MARRPEHILPPELYYNEDEAKKYTSNSRMISIQLQMSERALELLNIPDDIPYLILDIGCGSGLSGEVLTEGDHSFIGLDISKPMLDVALERGIGGDFLLGDMGQGLGFRAGVFDSALSISALQWLCNADKKSHNPPKRLYSFFVSLYSCLRTGGKAVFQFYPENSDQIELITHQAMRAGFSGGLVIDYPNSTKAKKIFLVLFAGGTSQVLPKALGTDDVTEKNAAIIFNRKEMLKKKLKDKAPLKKSKEWILDKKERRRRQGKDVRPDSKFTGRKRRHF